MKQKPEKKFVCGMVRATIWRNTRTFQGQEYDSFSIQLEKSYKDPQSNEWKQTNVLSPSDLPRAQLVLGKAYEFISLRGNGQEEDTRGATDAPEYPVQYAMNGGQPAFGIIHEVV